MTAIGNYAFFANSFLSGDLTIPNSISQIGDYAFGGCTNLTSVTIPNSVTSIGDYAFQTCYGLTSVTLPHSITAISPISITIPSSVTSIGNYAFSNCSSLTDVTCYAITPPTCGSRTFSTYSATLHVPATSLAAYFIAPYWSNFEDIIGDGEDPTGSIALNKDSIELHVGEQIRLIATITPPSSVLDSIRWQSTDHCIAIVENGKVTAIGIGECDIIATCSEMSAVCHVKVLAPQIIITLDQTEARVLPNHILTITPYSTIELPELTVYSSDPTVAAARVMNGKVQIVGIKEGTTTITVASSDGTAQPATCLVTVYTEPGDANCDGFVNVNDVTDLIDYLLGSVPTSFKEGNADLNGDGKINVADVTALIDQLLATGN